MQTQPLRGDALHAIMRSMPRERHQNGWVERTGKRIEKWTGFYYEYVRQADGSEKRMQRSRVLGPCKGLTKGDAEDQLRKTIRSDAKPVSADKFERFARWYLRTKQQYWARTTKLTMASIFETHIIPALGDKEAAKITKSEIEQALGVIAQSANSPSTLNKCLTHIRAVFQMGCDDEMLERNPALKAKIPPPAKVSERFLTLEECRSLIEAAAGRERLIVRTLITLGLRPSELFALKKDDITPGQLRIDEAVVLGQVGDTKTDDSSASIPLPPQLESDLRAFAGTNGSNWLFPGFGDKTLCRMHYLTHTLRPLGVAAGIPKLNFQILRRTCATHFQQRHGKVKDAQALLRHSSAETTMKHYIKSIDQSVVDGVASWDAELMTDKPKS